MALTISVEDIISTTNNPLLQAKPHWTRVRLGDVGNVLNGYAFKAELFNRTEGTPLIRIRDVGSDESATLYSGEFESKYLVQPGELLVGMDGDFNCARWRGKPSLLNQRVCKISLATDAYEDRFLDFVLPGYLKAINEATSSITVKHLSSRTIQDIPLPCPPIEEQREIVAELEKQFSRLDEAVANLRRVKANLKRYKASVLKDAVEGRLVPTEAELARREGRSFETGEQLLQRILEARRSIREGKGRYKEPMAPELVGSDLPEGWTWATIEQLGQVQLGKMLDKQKHLLGEPHRYLRNINVRWGAFDLSDLFEMNFESTQLERFGIRDGDVLVCEGGEPARAAVWRMGATDIKYQKALHRVRFDGAFVPELLMFTLEHLAKSGALEEMYGGSTIKHFTREVFVTLRVPVPPLAEQLRIVNEVERQLSIISAAEDQVNLNLARSTRLRQSVLASAFGQSVEGGSGNIVKEEDHTMKTGKLPALPAARKSEAEDYRQDLVIVLKRHPGGISAEQLFQEAGYRGDQVDAYYRDLALISAQLVQVLPDVDGRDWPASGSVLIQLKA